MDLEPRSARGLKKTDITVAVSHKPALSNGYHHRSVFWCSAIVARYVAGSINARWTPTAI